MNEDNAFQRSNDLLDTGAEAYRNGDYLTAQVSVIIKRHFIVSKWRQIKTTQRLVIKSVIFAFTGMHLRKTTIWPHILSKSCGNCR